MSPQSRAEPSDTVVTPSLVLPVKMLFATTKPVGEPETPVVLFVIVFPLTVVDVAFVLREIPVVLPLTKLDPNRPPAATARIPLAQLCTELPIAAPPVPPPEVFRAMPIEQSVTRQWRTNTSLPKLSTPFVQLKIPHRSTM